MPGEKILIVDDEQPINNLIRSYIVKEGFIPLSAFNGAQAIQLIKEEHPALILLDIMLPDVDGTDLCLDLRKITDVPIVFLSCKSEEIDKIVALSIGGDDYITKPFFPGELIARIKAHLRRQKILTGATNDPDEEYNVYQFPGLKVSLNSHQVVADGKDVKLTAKEFQILKLLIENPKRIFSADQLFELIWKSNTVSGDSKTVMVYISTLRKKIEVNPSNPKYIINIRNVGYKFNHTLI